MFSAADISTPAFAPRSPSRAEATPRGTEEQARAANYPLSRWYLRPLADRAAAALELTSVRPWHATLAGLLLALVCAAVLVTQPTLSIWCAPLVLATWFCDRCDGLLARRQGTATRAGAWLDANVDELVDLGLQAAAAFAAAQQGSKLAWPLWGAFVVGKYLLMYGLNCEESLAVSGPRCNAAPPTSYPSIWQRLYHFPGNADVRVHLLALSLAFHATALQLACLALYYNSRWLLRYALTPRRLGSVRP